MVTIDLFGGLGNQMFQYALGQHLAIKNGTELNLRFIDVGAFSKREYALGCFKLAPQVKVELAAGNKKSKIVAVLRKFLQLGAPENLVREASFRFDPKVLDLKGGVHLHGYWQTEKYFKDIRPIILDDFTFIKPLSRKNQKSLSEIQKSNSVSVHVRRGDYVIDPQTKKFHGVYGPDYYQKAVEMVSKKIKNPVFYFFSDNISWVKKNLKTKYKNVYVDWNTGKQSFVDMQLMSNCKHDILANSSFSWWGAWLNQNSAKIVIAPKRWFQDPNVDTRDLIPETWTKI